LFFIIHLHSDDSASDKKKFLFSEPPIFSESGHITTDVDKWISVALFAETDVNDDSTPPVGDSPRGPLKQRGDPHLNPPTTPKHAKPNHAGD
jgi:hypothetical protein